MHPETDCPNATDPASSYVVVYKKTLLVLCKECGPGFQLKAMLDVTPIQ
jgi:hypothetical protein